MKTIRKILLLGWGMLFFLVFSQGQDSIRQFELKDAVKYAEDHAYEVVSAGYELQQAKKKIWETIAIGLPQVRAEGNYTNNLELQTSLLPKKIFDKNAHEGQFVPVKFGQQYTAGAAITATQLIFDGTYIVGLKASKVFYRLSQDKMEKVKEGIKEVVTHAYFYALAAAENYQTLQENLANSKKIHEEAKAYYKVGLREDTDADQAALSVSIMKSKLNEAKRSVIAARTTLKYLMGIDVNTPIVLKSNLEELLSAILLKKKQIAMNWAAHIDYRILRTQYQAQQLMLKKEKATYLPALSAFYRYGKNTSTDEWNIFDKDTKWFNSSVVGLKLSFPLFSSGMRYSRVSQEKLALERVENQMKQKLQEMQQNMLLAKNNLETAKANFLNVEKSRNLAKKIYKKTQLKYTEGVSNSFELTQNEKQYLQAHSNYIGTMLELLKANVAYEKALGIL